MVWRSADAKREREGEGREERRRKRGGQNGRGERTAYSNKGRENKVYYGDHHEIMERGPGGSGNGSKECLPRQRGMKHFCRLKSFIDFSHTGHNTTTRRHI